MSNVIHDVAVRGPRLSLALAALLLFAGCGQADFVEGLSVVNATDFHANVDVRGAQGGWLDLTTVSAGETNEVGEVLDQGEVWTFRFSYGGNDPVMLELTRRELVNEGWRVEVPAEFEESLEGQGIPPPP